MENFEHEDTCLKFSRIYGIQFTPAIYAMAQSIRLFFSTAPQGALSEQGTVNQNTHLCLHKSYCNGLLSQIVTTKKMHDASVGSNVQRSQSLPCCPCSRYTAKCVRSCPCKQRGVRCSSCGPLSFDRCRNRGAPDTVSSSHLTHCDGLLVVDGGCRGCCSRPDGVDASGQCADDAAVRSHREGGVNDTFLCEKFERAFGAPLLNHDGGSDCEVRSLWWKVVTLRGRQYSLPDGGIGTSFVNMLSEEIERCTDGRQRSEREFIFTALVLQRNKMVRKGRDVRPLLARRMDMWEVGKLSELLQEAQ